MRISMEIIYENLAEFRPSGRKRRGWNEMRYLGFTPMGKKMRDLAEEFVILGRAEELEAAELPEKSGIICLGTPPRELWIKRKGGSFFRKLPGGRKYAVPF